METSTLHYGIAPPGYRLPAQTRVGRVCLQVSDLARSLDYYQRVLGFIVVEREGARALLASGGGGSPIVELRERRGARAAPNRGRLGLYHFAILLPERTALGRFVAHLARVGEPCGASDHLVSEALYLRDPDGLGIEVYADRPRSSWRHEGRQLLMSSEPLDLGGLARAAGEAGWDGLPGGTSIGHVHLHVGDIGEASRFFHDALGFDRTVWSYPGALFLAAGGYHHHLGVNTWAGVGAEPAAADDARLLHWEIVLPGHADVAAASGNVETAGYPVEADGAIRRTRDPWGTELLIRPA